MFEQNSQAGKNPGVGTSLPQPTPIYNRNLSQWQILLYNYYRKGRERVH